MMKMKGEKYEPILIDDGTLDTVVLCEGVEYRYTWGGMWDSLPENGEGMTYDDFVTWVMQDAVEQHEEASE